MKIVDTGVLGTSFMDFSIPSDFAKSALYYCPQFGHFYCTDGYNIAREHLELFLLVYMCGGSLHLEAEGRRDAASAGEIVLLDCRRPHRYYCSEGAEFLWLHFYGNASAPYTRYLIEQSGIVFSGERIPALRQSFETVIAAAQSTPTDEHQISLNLHRILSKLAAPEVSFAQLTQWADYVLVEADGSKRLPVKAHESYEPVVPPEANQTIALFGLSGLGKPIREVAHRAELYAKNLGVSPDTILTPQLAAAHLNLEVLHTRVLLNQADVPDGRALAREMAGALRTPACVASLREEWAECLS